MTIRTLTLIVFSIFLTSYAYSQSMTEEEKIKLNQSSLFNQKYKAEKPEINSDVTTKENTSKIIPKSNTVKKKQEINVVTNVSYKNGYGPKKSTLSKIDRLVLKRNGAKAKLAYLETLPSFPKLAAKAMEIRSYIEELDKEIKLLEK